MSEFFSSLCRRRAQKRPQLYDTSLKRDLETHDLILIGLANTIGSGIFILFGVAVHAAGPDVALSFLVTGLSTMCSALCYAEFAGRVSETGSAYTYTYMQAGEFFAWNTAWAMLLEMFTGAAAASLAFANYTRTLLLGMGIKVPWLLQEIPLGAFFKLDIMALSYLLYITGTVAMGMSESKMLNHTAAACKIGTLFLVIGFACRYADAANWADFSPHGAHGIIQGAATVMFAFSGFEVVAQYSEEARNPKWSVPISLVGTVVLSTILYTAVAVSMTLMLPFEHIDLNAPLALVFTKTQPWLVPVISAACVVGLFAIGMGSILGSSRQLMVLARDRLIPATIGSVSESTQTPVVATLLVGCVATSLISIFSYADLAGMVSVGTMSAFLMVCVDLIITRAHDEANPSLLPCLLATFVALFAATCIAWHRGLWAAAIFTALVGTAEALVICKQSKLPAIEGWGEDHFTVPCGVVVGLVGVAMNTMMMSTLEVAFERIAAWMLVGWVVYFGYGRLNSRLASDEATSLT